MPGLETNGPPVVEGYLSGLHPNFCPWVRSARQLLQWPSFPRLPAFPGPTAIASNNNKQQNIIITNKTNTIRPRSRPFNSGCLHGKKKAREYAQCGRKPPLKYVGTDRTKRDVGHGPELFCPPNHFCPRESRRPFIPGGTVQMVCCPKAHSFTILQIEIAERDNHEVVTGLERLTLCITTIITVSCTYIS